jgi:hypothetical protein
MIIESNKVRAYPIEPDREKTKLKRIVNVMTIWNPKIPDSY